MIAQLPEWNSLSPGVRWLIALGVMLLLGLLAWPVCTVLYHTGEKWRAHQLARQASDLLDHHNAAEAEGKLMAAFNLAPFDLVVLRTCAKCEEIAGNRVSLDFFQRLLLQPGATRDDKREALRANLNFGDFADAQKISDDLMAKDPTSEDYALQGQLYWAQSKGAEAIAAMRQAMALDSVDRGHQVLFAEMLVLSGDAQNQKEALSMVRELAQTQDENGLKALLIMAKDQGLDAPARLDILNQLKKYP